MALREGRVEPDIIPFVLSDDEDDDSWNVAQDKKAKRKTTQQPFLAAAAAAAAAANGGLRLPPVEILREKENMTPPPLPLTPPPRLPNDMLQVSVCVTPDSTEGIPLEDPLRYTSNAKDPVIARPKPNHTTKLDNRTATRTLRKDDDDSLLDDDSTASAFHAANANTPFSPRLGPRLLQLDSTPAWGGVAKRVLWKETKATTSLVRLEPLGRARSTQPTWLVQHDKRPFARAVQANLPTVDAQLPSMGSLSQQQQAKKTTPSTPPIAKHGRKLSSIARKGTPEAAAKAEDYVRNMIQDFQDNKSSTRPDGICFNLVLHAYAEHGNVQAAHAVLMLMYQDYKNGNTEAEPNVLLYTNLMHAWRKSRRPDAPAQIESIIENMHRLHQTGALPNCQPDKQSYTVLFHALTESDQPDTVERAERAFQTMKQHRYAGGQDDSLRPDTVTYTNLMNIFTRQASTYARAESILWEMVQDFQQGNLSAEPRIRNFNTILALYASAENNGSNDTEPDKAHAIVVRLIELGETKQVAIFPDKYTYGLLLKAWAHSKRPEGGTKAVKCLYWMEEMYHLGDMAAKLDVVKYSTCISTLLRRGQREQAQELLDKMRMDFVQGNEGAQPDYRIYEMVIAAWAGNYRGHKESVDGDRAERLLAHMWTLHETGIFENIRPTIDAYNMVILAMKKTKRPIKATELLKQAESLYEQGKLDSGPSKQMYHNCIKVWKESSSGERKVKAAELYDRMQQRFHHKGGNN